MPDALELIGPVLTDPWYVVDGEDRIIAFNAAFHALFPRPLARRLKGLRCTEALPLPPCAQEGTCLRQQACARAGPVRLEEQDFQLGERALRWVVSAVPLPLPSGEQGALIVLRDVTDEAQLQQRYQALVQSVEQERAGLQQLLDERTRELLAANDELNRLERELAALRRGGV